MKPYLHVHDHRKVLYIIIFIFKLFIVTLNILKTHPIKTIKHENI
jgi:hypothetical protein